ncbi:MAG: hypothetical protein ACP5RV_12840, partial [Thiomonas sp.]
GEAWTDNLKAIEDLARAVAAEQSSAGGMDAGESDQVRALKALLAAQIDTEINEIRGDSCVTTTRKRTVFEVFQAAKKHSPTAADNSAGLSLKRAGLMRVESKDGPRLFVSKENETLRVALRGTPWATGQSITGLLSRLPGAEQTVRRPTDTRPRILGSNVAGVYIKLDDVEFAEQNQPAPQDKEDIEF